MLLTTLAQDATSYQMLERSFAGRIQEGLLLTVVGMLVVFTALLVIGELIGWLSRLPALRSATAEEEAPPPARSMETTAFASATPEPAGLDARTLAVIAAAATVVVGGPVRLRRVTRTIQTSPPGAGAAWTEAGRLGLQTSHNVRR